MGIDAWDFIRSKQSLILSTIDENNLPLISYAPFVEDEENFYIFASAMAKHSKTILSSETISILFIEDEKDCEKIFARKRVTFDTKINHIQRDTISFRGVISLFYEKFGEDAAIYEQLGDFQLFKLTPVSGRAVFGFGQAYNFKDGEFKSRAVGM